MEAYDEPAQYPLDVAVSLVLAGAAGQPAREHPEIPVLDILRDCLGEGG